MVKRKILLKKNYGKKNYDQKKISVIISVKKNYKTGLQIYPFVFKLIV